MELTLAILLSLHRFLQIQPEREGLISQKQLSPMRLRNQIILDFVIIIIINICQMFWLFLI